MVKRYRYGLIGLIGDTGFAMNKNLEREDGAPIEGMRENAYFWRWFLDLLEHEVETWVPPPEQTAIPQTDPLMKMLPLLEIPPLKTNRPATSPATNDEDKQGGESKTPATEESQQNKANANKPDNSDDNTKDKSGDNRAKEGT
jgi:hypothetical protein